MKAHKYVSNNPSSNAYTGLVFCEYCGHIKYDANRESSRKLEPTDSECKFGVDIAESNKANHNE